MNTSSVSTIAVIGSGLSGLCAAFYLQKEYQVTLFEKSETLGGFPRPVTLKQGPDKGRVVDTGSILVNDLSTPKLNDFLRKLAVPLRPVTMDFGFHCRESGLAYTGKSLFAQRSNLLKPRYWMFATGVRRILERIHETFRAKQLENTTLGEFLSHEKCSADVVRDFIHPMAATVWPEAPPSLMDVPMLSLAGLFNQLYLFSQKDAANWARVDGGSRACAEALMETFKGDVITEAEVTAVTRGENGCRVICEGLIDTRFDAVVLATHADQSLGLLKDRSDDEMQFLGPWKYRTQTAFVHTDLSQLPENPRGRANWNVARDQAAGDSPQVSVTWDMTRCMDLDTEENYLVTVNPIHPIDDQRMIREVKTLHPLFTQEAMNVHSRLQRLNGRKRTFFCGNYLGYGTLEDDIESALTVARQLGIDMD